MLDLWQFKLSQMLCSTESIASTSAMDEQYQENLKSVMSLDYLHSVEMSLLNRGEAKEIHNEEDLDHLLGQYIRGDQTISLSPEMADLLATTLLLYDIPSKHTIQLDSSSKYFKCMVVMICNCVLIF